MDPSGEGKDWWSESGLLSLQLPKRRMSCPVGSRISPPSLTRAISVFLGVINDRHLLSSEVLPNTSHVHSGYSITQMGPLSHKLNLPCVVGLRSEDHLEAPISIPHRAAQGKKMPIVLALSQSWSSYFHPGFQSPNLVDRSQFH